MCFFLSHRVRTLALQSHGSDVSQHNKLHLLTHSCMEAIEQGPFLTIKVHPANCSCRIGHYKLVPPVRHVPGCIPIVFMQNPPFLPTEVYRKDI